MANRKLSQVAFEKDKQDCDYMRLVRENELLKSELADRL